MMVHAVFGFLLYWFHKNKRIAITVVLIFGSINSTMNENKTYVNLQINENEYQLIFVRLFLRWNFGCVEVYVSCCEPDYSPPLIRISIATRDRERVSLHVGILNNVNDNCRL